MDPKMLSATANEYERLINDGNIMWLPVNLEELPLSTRSYVEMMLNGYIYFVAGVKLNGTYLFKVNHPVVKYLHHVPQTNQHMWAGEGFHEFLDNDQIFDVLVRGAEYVGAPQSPQEDIC